MIRPLAKIKNLHYSGDRIQETGDRIQETGFRSQDSGDRRLFLFVLPIPQFIIHNS
jgi:hypothetical protein